MCYPHSQKWQNSKESQFFYALLGMNTALSCSASELDLPSSDWSCTCWRCQHTSMKSANLMTANWPQLVILGAPRKQWPEPYFCTQACSVHAGPIIMFFLAHILTVLTSITTLHAQNLQVLVCFNCFSFEFDSCWQLYFWTQAFVNEKSYSSMNNIPFWVTLLLLLGNEDHFWKLQ